MKEYNLSTKLEQKLYWQELISNKTLSELEKCFDVLQPDCAKVLRWHYFDGYTFQEIVPLLGKSISIVRNHHNRGIFLLNKQLKESKEKII